MGGWSPGPSILEGADWGRRVASCRSLSPPRVVLPLRVVEVGVGG